MPNITLEQYAKIYVDKMAAMSLSLGKDSKMAEACLLRAEHVMDFIEAHRDFCKKP